MTQRHGDAVQLDISEFKRFIRPLFEGCHTAQELRDMLWDITLTAEKEAQEVWNDRQVE